LGFRDTLRKVLKGQTEGREETDEMATQGVTILQDKKLAARLQALQSLFDELEAEITAATPIAYIEELDKRLSMLNRAIHSLAAPYYRAGTNPAFREMVEGWTLWHSLAKTWIGAVKDRVMAVTMQEGKNGKSQSLLNNMDTSADKLGLASITAIDIETLVRRLHHVMIMHVFQDGMLVLAGSFLGEDVAPSHAIVVKTTGQHGGFDISSLKLEEGE